MKVPVVVIIFNRPDKTKLLFESISKYKPDNLFIISDGPRKNVLNDKEKVKKTREVFKRLLRPLLRIGLTFVGLPVILYKLLIINVLW